MNLFKRLFRHKEKPRQTFADLPRDERIKIVMALGNSGKLEHYSLLKYCIESDPDKNVRFAALKRIHLFKDYPDLIPFLKNLEHDRSLEPYLSMALNRVGLISIEEFEKRIHNQ